MKSTDIIVEKKKNEFTDSLEHNVYWSQDKSIYYLSKYEIIVCLMCDYGLDDSPGIRRHLMSRHSYDWREIKKIENEYSRAR